MTLWNTFIGLLSFVIFVVVTFAFPRTVLAAFFAIFFVGCVAAIMQRFWKGGVPRR